MDIETKNIGIMVIALSLVLLFILIPFSLRLAEIGMSQCVHSSDAACSIVGHIPLESYIGAAAALILAGFGAFLMFRTQKLEKLSKEITQKIRQVQNKLDGDEKKVYQIVADSNGVLFQSELVEKSGMGKVRISRILDKLEAAGLLERKRRGMTNVVTLKR